MSQLDHGMVFSLEKDTDLLALAEGKKKTVMSLAEAACFAAKSKGVTELSLEDHLLKQRLSED